MALRIAGPRVHAAKSLYEFDVRSILIIVDRDDIRAIGDVGDRQAWTFDREAHFVMADAKPYLARRLQKRRARLHRVDQQQRGILRTLILGCAPFISIVENDDVLPALNRGAEIHMNRTHAPERRRGQPADFAATFKIDEHDLVPSSVVRQRDTGTQREQIARSSGSIESGEFCARREIVQRQLIAP
jgi:hypothetical protein